MSDFEQVEQEKKEEVEEVEASRSSDSFSPPKATLKEEPATPQESGPAESGGGVEIDPNDPNIPAWMRQRLRNIARKLYGDPNAKLKPSDLPDWLRPRVTRALTVVVKDYPISRVNYRPSALTDLYSGRSAKKLLGGGVVGSTSAGKLLTSSVPQLIGPSKPSHGVSDLLNANVPLLTPARTSQKEGVNFLLNYRAPKKKKKMTINDLLSADFVNISFGELEKKLKKSRIL